jgi:hypothetical protein
MFTCPPWMGEHHRAVTTGIYLMNAEPSEPQLDRVLLQLRIALANTLTVTDAIRDLQSKGNHLLPHLYTELATLQRAGRRARAVMRRYLPPDERSDE